MKALFLLTVFSVVVCLSDGETQTPIEFVLSNFDKWIEANKRVLLFFDDSNNHFNETVDKVAEVVSQPLPRPLKEKIEYYETPIIVSRVNCDNFKEFCESQVHTRIPFIVFYSYVNLFYCF